MVLDRSEDRVTGARLYMKQASAIIIKRFIFNYRNIRGLATQILLPAFFITVAMTVALTAPGFADPPPITLSTAMFSHLNHLYTPVSGINDFKSRNRSRLVHENANPMDLLETLTYPSGLGATCVLTSPFLNRTFLTNEDFTGSQCSSVYQKQDQSFSINDINWTTMFSDNQTCMNRPYQPVKTSSNRFYSPCQCSKIQSRFICPAFAKPDVLRLISNDRILNITNEKNEILYYLYTTDEHHLDRYGGLSFGLAQDFVPEDYPTDRTNELLQKLAVKDTARIFTNHKGYHTLPLYINVMSNIILRANLPAGKGLASAYGITTINRKLFRSSSCYR